jgi:hypothetical protein
VNEGNEIMSGYLNKAQLIGNLGADVRALDNHQS